MKDELTVTCGTYKPHTFTFNISAYGKAEDREGVSDQDLDAAFILLHKTMDDESFIADGCRNEDAVNSCIALHVLGYDPVKWFDRFFKDNRINEFWFSDIEAFKDHLDRVVPYLEGWGPEGNEGAALGYSI